MDDGVSDGVNVGEKVGEKVGVEVGIADGFTDGIVVKSVLFPIPSWSSLQLLWRSEQSFNSLTLADLMLIRYIFSNNA